MSEEEKVPDEFYRLVITKTINLSKAKSYLIQSIFDWEDKSDALEVKRLLLKANQGILRKKSIDAIKVEFKIIRPDTYL